jgi:DNA-binding CsgD family transcriptional regulator
MYIRLKDLRAVERLWRELAEFPLGAADQKLQHCFRELARLTGAANVYWVAGGLEKPVPRGDWMRGWRVRAFFHLHHDDHQDRLLAAAARHVGAGLRDPHTEAIIATAGVTRAFLRHEIVDDRVWRRAWMFNEVLLPLGITDRLIGAHAVDARHESYIGLDRAQGRPFGERERDLLRLFLAGAPRFHGDIMRAHGLIDCVTPLTLREQQVLPLLLTDLTEKQIAAELGVGWRTAHQHAVSICRKFRVKRRAGLMALWLGRNPTVSAI